MTESSLINSQQIQPHKNLQTLVEKHLAAEFKSLIPVHTQRAFAIASEFVDTRPVILDSGCGVGESSFKLAHKFSEHCVVAVDKSAHRLQRCHAHGPQPENLLFVRADCVHLWRLIQDARQTGTGWQISQHYLFYPNPWPKPGHLQRRWHGHSVFPTLLALGGDLTLRTNWKVYAEEFLLALRFAHIDTAQMQRLHVLPGTEWTAFERKYQRSQHPIYQVTARLSEPLADGQC